MRLDNQVIAITGGGRGIGRVIGELCAEHGAKVALCARSASELQATMDELTAKSGRHVMTSVCDVTKQSDLQKFFTKATSEFGKLTGLICAAGIYGPIRSFAEVDFEKWKQAIDVNLIGTALSVHTALPFFDAERGGRVLLFSGGGQGPLANFSAYVTSKGGIWRLTETLGAELASRGIYVNAIAPGAVNTKLLDDLLEAGPASVGKEMYQKALEQKEKGGTPANKAAELVLYLLSEKSKGLYGKTLSAVWDPYHEFKNPEAMSKTDIYQVRRVVDDTGATRAK